MHCPNCDRPIDTPHLATCRKCGYRLNESRVLTSAPRGKTGSPLAILRWLFPRSNNDGDEDLSSK